MVNQIDLRQLASFVLACQNPTISETARELGISVSTLSVSLHTLERNLGLKLFQRKGRFLSPLPAAFWLFQHATALLHAESFTVTSVARLAEPELRIHLRLSLMFTMGRFSRAIARTLDAMRRAQPAVQYDFTFLTADQIAHSGQDALTGPPLDVADCHVDIGYLDEVAQAPTIPLYDEQWVALKLIEAPTDLRQSRQPLVVLRMQRVLVDAVSAHAQRQGFANRLSFLDEQPIDLPDLMARMPGSTFLVPQTMLGERLGMVQQHAQPLDPPLHSRISARLAAPHRDEAMAFIGRLKEELAGPAENPIFAPTLTARQICYFNATARSGGLTAAARAANVTQPTVSLQIKGLEVALGQKLFERSPSGMRPTRAGRLLAPLSLDLEARLSDISNNLRSIAASTRHSLAIGFLPSSGHDSAMTALLCDALTTLRHDFPDCRLTIIEDTNAALHDAVRSGDLNLAVVGSVIGTMPRVKLGPSELLSIIAHPSLGLGGRKKISLAEACALPLVLGPRFLSIHAAFATAAADLRLPVNQVVEAGSIPIAIAMARRSPLCTVLPASSVRRDVAEKRLTSTPIAEGLSAGNLSVIFSGERELWPVERAAVRALAAVFKA